VNDLGPLFDGPPQIHRNPDTTEVEAAAKVESTVATWRREVYQAVKASPIGLAGFEVCALYPDRTESSVRTRLTELSDLGLLRKEGKRMNTRGNNEMVWHATDTPWSDYKPTKERCPTCGQIVR